MPLCNSYNKMFKLRLIVHTLWNQLLLELNSYNKMFKLWLIVHTLWNQLLLELLLDLFNTLQKCYRHIEDMHVEVWCWKNIFWQTDRVLNLAIFWRLYNKMFVLWLIVHTLWNQLLSEPLLDLFSTLQKCYRHIEDVHVEVWCWKNIFWQTDMVLNLAIFRQLHLAHNG